MGFGFGGWDKDDDHATCGTCCHQGLEAKKKAYARELSEGYEEKLRRLREENARMVPWVKVSHLMAMLLRIGLVKMEWFETWHPDLHARFKDAAPAPRRNER